MDYLHSSDKIDQLLENINSGTALAVSDGSYYPYEKIGAAAWIITAPDETQWIKGGGPKKVQSAYRSEVGGLVGIAVCLTSLSSHLNHTEPPITTACDGLSALKKVHATKEMVKPSWKHVDLLTGLIDLFENLPMKARLEHVLGHQDDVGRPLTLLERINVRMDSIAKTIALTHPNLRLNN
jgi:hypothetical protein